MPLKRFLEITRFLQLNDNQNMSKNGVKDFNKLYRVIPFIDYFTKRF